MGKIIKMPKVRNIECAAIDSVEQNLRSRNIIQTEVLETMTSALMILDKNDPEYDFLAYAIDKYCLEPTVEEGGTLTKGEILSIIDKCKQVSKDITKLLIQCKEKIKD